MRRNLVLDFSRGVAALGIVAFHIFATGDSLFVALFFFVDFFFVLSGFVLAPSLNKVDSTQALKEFIVKRALRIFPMAISGICFVVSIQLIVYARDIITREKLSEGIDLSFSTIVLNILLLQVFSLKSQLLLFPLWSLSAEWITNLAYGFLRVAKARKLLFLIPFGVLMLIIGLTNSLSMEMTSISISLGRCFYGFGVGLLCFHLFHKRINSYVSSWFSLFVFPICLIQYSLYFFVGMNFFIVLPIGFGAIVLLLALTKESLSNVSSKIFAFFGRHSYGVYVWHVPMSNLLSIVENNLKTVSFISSPTSKFFLASILSVFASSLVIKMFEKPIQKAVKSRLND